MELEKNDKKDRIMGIEFARAFCAIGIIMYHYFCHSAGTFKFFYATANAGWGDICVTVFFAISGLVLYYNYPKISSLKVYYWKRWKSIFPAFYLCFLFFYLCNVFKFHNLFYIGSPLKFIFTILGIDGYFLYKITNYYIIGEWFLGAIIFLYLIYPLLSFIFNKNVIIILPFLIIGYILMYHTDYFQILKFRNLITCMLSFYFGMIVSKYKEFFFQNKFLGFFSLIIFLFLCCFHLPNFYLNQQLQGFLLLIILVQSGNYLMKTKIKNIITEISNLSFYIFLFQHIIILDMLGVANPEKWYKILIVLFSTIVLTIICAKVLSIVVNALLNSRILKKIESRIL